MENLFLEIYHEEPIDKLSLGSLRGGISSPQGCTGTATNTCYCDNGTTYCFCNSESGYYCPCDLKSNSCVCYLKLNACKTYGIG